MKELSEIILELKDVCSLHFDLVLCDGFEQRLEKSYDREEEAVQA